MEELRGIDYLRRQLAVKQGRVRLRYKFYDMKREVPDLGIATPPKLRGWMSSLGWCAKAVDALADRLTLTGFKNDGFNIWEIYQQNNPDIMPSAAILAALIGSCSFIYIYPDDNGYPRMQTIDGTDASGIVDQVTGLLKEGYAVLERDKNKSPLMEAYFEPGKITYYEKGQAARVFQHGIEYSLLVPIIYRPDAARPFGHSRISRSCMSIMESAVRTAKRSEITAEFYSFPQKWVSGLDPDAEQLEKWQASMSSLLTFSKDDQGDRPTLGQFTQATMTPHLEQLRMFASLFAGETGLTLDDIGFPSDNPTSAEAIRAGHENLRLMARRAQRDFGTGFLNAGFVARCVADEFSYERWNLMDTTPLWAPIFEADASQLSGLGDAIGKIQQAFPDYFTEEKLKELTGI